MLDRDLHKAVRRWERYRSPEDALELGRMLDRCDSRSLRRMDTIGCQTLVSLANVSSSVEAVNLAWLRAIQEGTLPLFTPEAFTRSDISLLPEVSVKVCAVVTYATDAPRGWPAKGDIATVLFGKGVTTWMYPNLRYISRDNRNAVWKSEIRDFPGFSMNLLSFLDMLPGFSLSNHHSGFSRADADFMRHIYESRYGNFGLNPWYRERFRALNPNVIEADRRGLEWRRAHRGVSGFLDRWDGLKDFSLSIRLELSQMNVKMFSGLSQEQYATLQSWGRELGR